jgi:hypothetical protein
MDHNFYNNDFEKFLKQKADQYKMYPSDRVWDNIYSSLHGRKKWLVFGLTLLFVASSLFIGKQAVLYNYNRVATQLNKGPELMFSSSRRAVTRNAHQYILSTRLKPANRVRPDYIGTIVQPLEKNTATSDISALINKNDTKIAQVSTEAAPLVIENNLLPAAISAHAINLANTIPAEKQAGSDIDAATKPIPLKTNNAGDNEIAGVTPVKASPWFLQFYVSPIISYRRLSNQNQPDYNLPVSASYAGNINRYVHHEPAPGFEAGGKVLFKLSNSLSLYAGAQLNYSRYYIDAYKYHVEKASIALKNSSRTPDTVSGYTTIRNFSGYEPEQLQNQYWQFSVPIGMEIKLLGDKKLQLNVAGGVQPTFLISSNSYLISSDYKNYIQSPDLARSFNVHTNFEAFISYQTGGIKWQLGPQFRSQLLSSYSNQYRVHEYLTEFGIKFGITKSFR